MTTEELRELCGEIFSEYRRLTKRANQKAKEKYALEVFRLHVSSLRIVPNRIKKALEAFSRKRGFPPLKYQDELILIPRAWVAIEVLSEALRRKEGENFARKIIEHLSTHPSGSPRIDKLFSEELLRQSSSSIVMPELDMSELDGDCKSVIRWLFIGVWEHVPDAEALSDAAARTSLENLEKSRFNPS